MPFKVSTAQSRSQQRTGCVGLFFTGAFILLMSGVYFSRVQTVEALVLLGIIYILCILSPFLFIKNSYGSLVITPQAIIYKPPFARKKEMYFFKSDIRVITLQTRTESLGKLDWLLPSASILRMFKYDEFQLVLLRRGGEQNNFEISPVSLISCLDLLQSHGYLSPSDYHNLRKQIAIP